jgi:hypothetical protein
MEGMGWGRYGLLFGPQALDSHYMWVLGEVLSDLCLLRLGVEECCEV